MDLRRLRTDLLALCLLALCVFLTLCLWSYDPADPPSRLVYPARSEPVNVCGNLRLADGPLPPARG